MPPAYEILLLNTAVPQIQAAQSGDTYVVPRDIAFSAALTLSAGTANGVPYLSSPGKVLTTGSALTFDGSQLGVGVSLPVAPVEIQSNSGATAIRIRGRASANSGTLRYFSNDGTTQLARIEASDNAFEIGGIANIPITFLQNGTEQMRLTSTGLKASIAGTNADPVFSYTSDTNTGIFFPAADKLGFVAGGGSDQMVLTTTGLGIGTSSPGFAVDIAKATAVLRVQSTTGTNSAYMFTTNTGGDFYVGRDNSTGSTFGSNTAYTSVLWSAGAYPMAFFTNGGERARITSGGDFQTSSGGSVQVGGTAARATTAGTNRLDIFDGTAPVGTLANGVSFYSTAGEARVMDAAGNATLLSPHDTETNEWIFHSKHTPTGKVLRIDVERLLKFVNDHFGLDAVQEFIEE
jgi:hypothetical protein